LLRPARFATTIASPGRRRSSASIGPNDLPDWNAVDPGTSNDNADAAAAPANFPQLTLLDAPIGRRKASPMRPGRSWSVDELVPPGPTASAELAALLCKVLSLHLRL
jgi:hypothetical protein